MTQDRETIVTNALRAAAEVYEQDAQRVEQSTIADLPGIKSLADQFRLQSREARELREQIEEHGLEAVVES